MKNKLNEQHRKAEDAVLPAHKVMNFAAIRQSAPGIHVFDPTQRMGKNGVTVLTAKSPDDSYEIPYGRDYIEGDGSRLKPYQYLSAAPVSPHYGIIDMWLQFREQQVFIKANDWLLEVSPEGVTSADGYFTQLL